MIKNSEEIVEEIIEVLGKSGCRPVPQSEKNSEEIGIADPLVYEYSKMDRKINPTNFWGIMIGYSAKKKELWLHVSKIPATYTNPDYIDKTLLTKTKQKLTFENLYYLALILANKYKIEKYERPIPIIIFQETINDDSYEWRSTPLAIAIENKNNWAYLQIQNVKTAREHIAIFHEEGIAVVSVDSWTNFGTLVFSFKWEEIKEIQFHHQFSIVTSHEINHWFFNDNTTESKKLYNLLVAAIKEYIPKTIKVTFN